MAYGQTGTGKTYTVGNLGKDDESERGIMVRAVEDIIRSTSCANESVEVSYLQVCGYNALCYRARQITSLMHHKYIFRYIMSIGSLILENLYSLGENVLCSVLHKEEIDFPFG